MSYKFDEHDGLVDSDGKQILQLVPNSCTKKFRREAGKLLAEKLNELMANDHREG